MRSLSTLGSQKASKLRFDEKCEIVPSKEWNQTMPGSEDFVLASKTSQAKFRIE